MLILYTFNNSSISRTINLVDVIMLLSLVIVTDEAAINCNRYYFYPSRYYC